MSTNVIEFLDSVGARPTSKQSEWLMDCWDCGEHKLYFNTDKIVGYCVKCDKTRTLFDIAKFVAHVPFSQIQEFIENHKTQDFKLGSFRESMEEGLFRTNALHAEKQLKEMQWPEGYRSLYEGRSSVTGRKAATYLTGRGFNLDVLYGLGFGYCGDGFYSGRVIVPSTIDGRLVYWQARDFTGSVPLSKKILNPSTKFVPNGKSQVLFNYDTAKRKNCVIIVESWGSALATGSAATAVNGKHISDSQLKLLAAMEAESFIVMFDAGVGVASGWDSAEDLSKIRPTYVATLPWGDPNEVPAKVRNAALRDCELYSKASHIKYRIQAIGQKSK